MPEMVATRTNTAYTCASSRTQQCQIDHIESRHSEDGMTQDQFYCSHGAVVRIITTIWRER